METLLIHPDENIKQEQLGLLRERLAQESYPGYPTSMDRLVSDLASLAVSETGELIIGDGTWTVNAHANRPDREDTPSDDEQLGLVEQGFALDSMGRPLHPWFKEMVEDPEIGIVTGKGAYWRWGANHTADAAVFRDDEVLVIERGDTGTLALPGGFVDPGESPYFAAPREVAEESKIVIPEYVLGYKFYEGPVVDLRATANAWPETTGYFYELPLDDAQIPVGADDAQNAQFVHIYEALYGSEKLFGAHNFLLRAAVRARSTLNQRQTITGDLVNAAEIAR